MGSISSMPRASGKGARFRHTLPSTDNTFAYVVNGATVMGEPAESVSRGSIAVFVPAGFNADIGASTVGGRLSSDFPLSIERKRMHGVLGSGGHDLKLSTVNGTVQLRRLR